MNGRDLFDIWAPRGAPWSPWAKPVLFAALDQIVDAVPPISALTDEEAGWLRPFGRHTAFVLDLPGLESMKLGLQMTARGFRPVPLFNAAYGRNAVVPVLDIVRALRRGGEVLSQVSLPPDASPAFLLDANRRHEVGSARPGQFDNRWIVFPQDFPSAAMLKARDVHAVVLVQRSRTTPRDDLAHVLLRWQEAGIAIYARSDNRPIPEIITVTRPSRYRSFFHRLFATAGLLRNSAGGFGSVIPEPGSGSGFG